MIIAVDFDGTLAEHEYPDIGAEVPHAFATLRVLQQYGVKLILLTMRSGRSLNEAVEFCRERGVEFWAVNENPEQEVWTSSRKVYANIYIDDAAFGCPLKGSAKMGARSYVDWNRLALELFERLMWDAPELFGQKSGEPCQTSTSDN